MKAASLGTTDLESDQRRGFQEQLRTHPLYASMPEAQLARIIPEHDIIALRAGTTFITEGAETDALYIVLTGRCAIDAGGRIVRTLGRGGVLGELGMLANAKRSASVTTTRDSVVAMLPRTRLERIADQAPSVWRALGECAARRVVGVASGEEAGHGAVTLALVGTGDVDLPGFTAQLVEAFARIGRTTEFERMSGSEALLLNDEMERAHDFVISRTDPGDPKWTRRCLRQADRVVVIGDGTKAPPAEVFSSAGTDVSTHLILLQPSGITVASDTARWLDAVEPKSHHHVRQGNDGDLNRAARLLAGRGVGVSLAGAASRGIGHFGLLRALREAGVPIDSLTGASAGSAVAATVAMNLTHEQGVAFFSAMLECCAPTLGRITAPVVALMTGRVPVATLQTLCRGYRIEDLLIPLQIPATDLLHAERYVFTRGPVWRALRASGSLPLFWPPLVWDNRVLVDSGLISNQPVDLLMETCGRGWMIAQDLLPGDLTEGPLGGLDASDSVSGWRLLWERIWPFGRRTKAALLPDVIVHSMTIPSYQAQREWDAGPRDAHVLMLRPQLPNYSFFAVGPDLQQGVMDSVHEQATGPVQQGWAALNAGRT